LILYSMARDFGLVFFHNDQFAMMVPATIVLFVVGWLVIARGLIHFLPVAEAIIQRPYCCFLRVHNCGL